MQADYGQPSSGDYLQKMCNVSVCVNVCLVVLDE